MSPREYNLHNGKRGSAIAVRVTPRASNNEVAEILHDGTIRIRLTAPPIEGKANQELAKFLSDILGVPKSNIEIVAGQSGRDKLVSILDMDAATAQQKILAHLV